MTTFDSREKAFEDKYAHDSEMQFKANARRDRLFGEWLAGEMGMSGEAVVDYGKSMVIADLEEPGDGDVMRKALEDVESAGLDISEHMLRKKLDALGVEAKAQILAED